MTENSAPSNSNPASGNGGKEGEYWETSNWVGLTPHCIYFYYFTPSAGGYDNKYYFYDNGDHNPIDQALLATKIDELLANAVSGGNSPSPMPTKFGEEDWVRISWLVVAVEGDEFSRNDIKIKHKKRGGGEGNNHTFFDGNETVKQVLGKTIGVLWAQNHMRDTDGELLPQKCQAFHFKFKSKQKRFFEFDESGTNTGPPVTPPPSPPPPPLDFKPR